MTSDIAGATFTSHPPVPSPKRTKKVRVQESVVEDSYKRQNDTFHVSISDVRGTLMVSETRPVFLTFHFDDYWYAETNVWNHNVNPIWRFNAATIRPGQTNHYTKQHNFDVRPVRGTIPEAKFVYQTKCENKLSTKYLTVKLSERSRYGDVEWGQGQVRIDSIVCGCPVTDISIINHQTNVCYGNISCIIQITNVEKVRLRLTDLQLSDYPVQYKYDTKLIYFELGFNGFEDGYRHCTKPNYDHTPTYSRQPPLELDTTLENMLKSSSSTSNSLKVYFSVHRQVARNRTEEIGVGALPIRMLFAKVTDGEMKLPTKFKVPLANYKGFIRGKVHLRNIPRFSQLLGDDLVNVDGHIYPLDQDLTKRKLQPWISLPESTNSRAKLNATSTSSLLKQSQSEIPSAVTEHIHARPISVAKSSRSDYITSGRGYSSLTESASDGGSESSIGNTVTNQGYVTKKPKSSHSIAKSKPTNPAKETYQVRTKETEYDPVDHNVVGGVMSTRYGPGQTEELKTVDQSRRRNEWTIGMTREEESGLDDDTRVVFSGNHGLNEVSRNENSGTEGWERLEGMSLGQTAQSKRQRAQVEASSTVWAGEEWEGVKGTTEYSDAARGRGNKSAKSTGSGGTADAGVEIGSAVLSTASDDGYVTASRTTTEDVLTISQRLSTGPPSEDRYDTSSGDVGVEVGHGEMTMGDGMEQCGFDEEHGHENGVNQSDEEEAEWKAIFDPSSGRYYFAHKYTHDSLWLPPEWERMEDDEGREYFVDHGRRETQREFPVVEARAYRDSVYSGRQ